MGLFKQRKLRYTGNLAGLVLDSFLFIGIVIGATGVACFAAAAWIVWKSVT
jgi:hypothetical protein